MGDFSFFSCQGWESEWCPHFSGVWGASAYGVSGLCRGRSPLEWGQCREAFARGGAAIERGRGGHVWEGDVGVVLGSQPPRLLLRKSSKSVDFHHLHGLLCELEILTFQSRKRH